MTQDNQTTILFAIDFSEMTDFVIREAISQAKLHDAPALHAVCVVEPSDNPLSDGTAADVPDELALLNDALRARIASAFAAAGHPLDDAGAWSVHTHVRRGRPANEIEDLSVELRADTIILGRHGAEGFRPFLLGSVPSRLLAVARCTVVVVQPPTYQ